MSNLKDAKFILKQLQDKGYEAYIVGGYVRDFILGNKTSDIDIATNATPDIVKTIFEKTILTGLKHGTVTVIFQDAQYEVTTFRTEGLYEDNRRPNTVTFVSSLKEDVLRRDFTMNALALTIDSKIIDYVGGKEDISQKLIRTVGNPYERFREDALRMLRAFRFVSKLGFTIDKKALKAITENAALMHQISKERILKEFENMLIGTYFLQGIKLMIKSSFHKHLPEFTEGLEKMKETGFKPNDMVEFLAFCAVCKDFESIKQLPISNEMKRLIKIAYEMYQVGFTEFPKTILFRNGLEPCLLTNKLNVYLKKSDNKEKEIKNIYEEMPIHHTCDLAFKGDDIIKLIDKTPGAWISELLDELSINVLMGILPNDKEKLKTYVLKREEN